MSDKPTRRRWVGWIFLGWTAIVLGVYGRQLLVNAAAMGISLNRLLEAIR